MRTFEAEAFEFYVILITRYGEMCPHCGSMRRLYMDYAYSWQWNRARGERPDQYVYLEIARWCACPAENMRYKFRDERTFDKIPLKDTEEMPF